MFRDQVKFILETGAGYHCFCTDLRLDLLRREALRARQVPRYDNRCRHLSETEVRERLERGDDYCIRFKVQYLMSYSSASVLRGLCSNPRVRGWVFSQFLWFIKVPPRKCWDSTLEQITATLVFSLSLKLTIRSHLTLQHYVIMLLYNIAKYLVQTHHNYLCAFASLQIWCLRVFLFILCSSNSRPITVKQDDIYTSMFLNLHAHRAGMWMIMWAKRHVGYHSLMLELSERYTLQKTLHVNDWSLLCTLLAVLQLTFGLLRITLCVD